MWGVYSGYLGSENFYIFSKGSVMNIDCIYSLSLPLYLKIVHITNTQILTIRVLLLPPPSCFSRVQLCATPRTAANRLLCPWYSPGKNTGVGCHFRVLTAIINSCLKMATVKAGDGNMGDSLYSLLVCEFGNFITKDWKI